MHGTSGGADESYARRLYGFKGEGIGFKVRAEIRLFVAVGIFGFGNYVKLFPAAVNKRFDTEGAVFEPSAVIELHSFGENHLVKRVGFGENISDIFFMRVAAIEEGIVLTEVCTGNFAVADYFDVLASATLGLPDVAGDDAEIRKVAVALVFGRLIACGCRYEKCLRRR